MRHAIIILKWEIQKILTSWQKTLAVFLVPAAVMVGAINLFPKLLTYLTTGSLGSQKVIVVNAPDSFMSFDGKQEDLLNYSYMTMEEWQRAAPNEEEAYKIVKGGSMILVFTSPNNMTFDDAIREKNKIFYETGRDKEGAAKVYIVYNAEMFTAESKMLQFSEDVVNPYISYANDLIGSEYTQYSASSVSTDDFNPITYILDNRSTANTQASRIIPAIMVILMYYCCYSLACDMIAMEKNRGFLSKLVMTPVSPKMILWGKAMAVNVLVTGSSIMTFLFLFLSSWVNRSNDAGTLLPFGLMLMPDQLLYMLLAIPATVLVMTAFCFLVSLDLEKFDDTVANLQLVLLLLLIGLFIQMFIFWSPSFIEYVIPVHNTIVLLRDILMSEVNIVKFLAVLITNLGLGLYVMDKCTKKLEKFETRRRKRR